MLHEFLSSFRREGDRRNVYKNVHFGSETILGMITGSRYLSLLVSLLGPSVAIENTFLIWKDAGDDFSVPWHQDGINNGLRLNPGNSVSLVVAMTACTVASGTIEVYPGSHKNDFLPFGVDPGAGSSVNGSPLSTAVPPPSDGAIAVPLAAGQACLFDVRLLHRSGINSTASARVALNIRFVGAHGIEFMADAHGPLVWVAGSQSRGAV
jgi:ectoine hydroxylase-related dioxygenase (phytanoyl-CoA dioxygenase family)